MLIQALLSYTNGFLAQWKSPYTYNVKNKVSSFQKSIIGLVPVLLQLLNN